MKKVFAFLFSIILSMLIALVILIKMDFINIEIIKPTKKPDDYINNGLLLEDENLSKSNGKIDKFYYNQLDVTAQKIYDELITNEEILKTGNAELKFEEGTFDDVLNEENGMSILSTEYQNAIDAIRYDRMDMFYLDFTKMALKTITYTRGNEKRYEVYLSVLDGCDNYFQDYVKTKEEIEPMLMEIEAIKEIVLKEAQGTNYQKIHYIHNWLIDNIQYDTTYEQEHTRDIYGALLEQKVVCEGYAKAFKYLMDELEIPCIIVSGKAINSEGKIESHMWNYVQINEIWYSIDITWDDPILINTNTLPEASRYKYFCQGDNINENHFLNSKITENCQEFEYPELYHKENN